MPHNDYARNRATIPVPYDGQEADADAFVPCRIMETRACMTNRIRWDDSSPARPVGYEFAAEPCKVFCVRYDRELTGE